MDNTALLWRLLTVDDGGSDPGTCSLGTIAAALGMPSHRPHTAEGDTLTAAQVFLAMATHLEARGHGTVRALTGASKRLRVAHVWTVSRGVRSG